MKAATVRDTERRLLTDTPFFSKHVLKIRAKSGEIIPLDFNRAQKHAHKKIEEQRARTGKVRAIFLKGRQQGLSTYVAARYYHKTTTIMGTATFIMAHDADGSDTLYTMAREYYDNAPEYFRPPVGASNRKELSFPTIRCSYRVGTPGSKGVGRSKTFNHLHWSEVAYSPNCDAHAAGILQTVPDLPGTEIILESTSNGEGDYFHRACMLAMQGKGDFILIFVPWYWQDEYTRPLPDDFTLEEPRDGEESASEREYYNNHKADGLTLEHLAWRRNKIITDFKGDTVHFMREYPFTPEEAFMAASDGAYIHPRAIQRARRTPVVTTSAPLIFGVDPARLGGDGFRVAHRKGRNITAIKTLPPGRTDESARRLAEEITRYKPASVNIDCGGLGVGVYDALIGLGYGGVVRKVDFGSRAVKDPDRNYNKRAEMARAFSDALDDEPFSISCDEIPAQKLQSQCAVISAEYRNNSQLLLTPKEKIKADLGYSPDEFDAVICTFAEPVHPSATYEGAQRQAFVANTEWSPFD